MDSLFSRYRNLTVLLMVIFAQLLLLAYQVKTNKDVRLIRVWAVTAVTPLARVLESFRSGTLGLLENYTLLVGVRQENQRLNTELGRLKMENQFFKTELSTAERAEALRAFQSRVPSRTIATRVIGTGTGTDSRIVFVDRGLNSGVVNGMAVVTPDGVVGRVRATYSTTSQVLLITDPGFAAGAVSQKNHVYGILRGLGQGACAVDYVENEDKVEVGETFFTSGDDRVFPRGLPIGKVTATRPGSTFQEIRLSPDGLRNGLEVALIVLEGIHQTVPEAVEQTASDLPFLPPPPAEGPQLDETQSVESEFHTDADEVREKYRRIGESQDHIFGENLPGEAPPDFNREPKETRPPKATSPETPSAVPSRASPVGQERSEAQQVPFAQ